MKKFITLALGDDTVRFTPDGRIAVIDAIAALSQSASAVGTWRELKRLHPKLEKWCDLYNFISEKNVPVADSCCWGHIQDLLLERLIDEEL